MNTKKNKTKVKIKTICVGNIYIGGTGKTSLSIKINELLKKKYKILFYKKIYTRQLDEQSIGKQRKTLSKKIKCNFAAQNENYEVAILDDGLQDHSIDYDLRFVCFNNINWKGNGMTIHQVH